MDREVTSTVSQRLAASVRDIAVVINRSSGTVRTLGAEAVERVIREGLGEHEGPVRIDLIDGHEITEHVDRLIAEKVGAIIVAGGDGTISSIAGQLTGTGIALGVLPMGTMNLFAKAIGMSNDLAEALSQLGSAEPVAIDTGAVNGRVFLHHVSLGMQPKLVRLRERLGYSSRLTKILASLRAFLLIMRRPPVLRLETEIDGASKPLRAPAFVVSNNMFGRGHLPFQDALDQGVLGVYVLATSQWLHMLQLTKAFATGTWHESPHVEIVPAQKVAIKRRSRRGKKVFTASLDGEIVRLPSPALIEIKPKALNVLKPKRPEPAAV
jgi:diacylglycerol kinase family enzyme